MSTDPSPPPPESTEDEGPGCMPAILASMVLLGILGFLTCGVMTWLIFDKQDELALRSMRGSFIPAVEQSLLAPKEKAATVKLLDEFADQLERGRLEGWQASGVMQRLTRLPVLQWGQLRRVELFVDERPDDFSADDSVQFDRLRRGVERNKITTIDFVHILTPVLQSDSDSEQASLAEPLDIPAVAEVVARARTSADRAEVDANPNDDVGIDTLVRRQIEAGIQKGTY